MADEGAPIAEVASVPGEATWRPHVAVVIVGFRNVDDILRCLSALDAATYRNLEVVICENGGEAAFAELASRLAERPDLGLPVKAFAAPHNLGFAGGVNRGLEAAPNADAYWVLNPDTEPEPDALSSMVSRLARRDCDAVGCTVYLPDGRVQSHGGRWQAWLARSVSLGNGTSLDEPVSEPGIEDAQNYLNGATMVVSRRFLDLVGPMREDYFLYAEEVEWCLRGAAKQMKLGFAAGARVKHAQGSTTGAGGGAKERSRLSVYLSIRNEMLLTRDRFPLRLPVAALCALLVFSISFGRRGAWGQWGHALSGWLAGLRNERGAPAWVNAR